MIALSGLVVAGLAACSEDPGEARPGPSGGDDLSPPAAVQAPDVRFLEATLRRTLVVLEAAARVSDDDPALAVEAIRTALETQARVLTEMVLAGGGDGSDSVETAEVTETTEAADSTASPDVDSATSTGPSPGLDPAQLAELLVESSLDDSISEELSTVTGINLPTLMALHGQRIAAARMLGGRVRLPALRGPSGAGAITMLAGLRQVIYGLEVLAARSADDERETYRDALASLRGPSRMITQLAGPSAPAPPLGYGLPSALSTTRERNDAAQELFVALSQSMIAGSSARAFDDDAINGTIALMALSVEVGTTFGVPMDAFPGLSIPEAN